MTKENIGRAFPVSSNGMRHSVAFPSIVTAVVCVAALYFARAVLVPLALAIFLSFLLAPIVNWMERLHLGRSGPVVFVVILAISIFLALAWVVVDQGIALASQIPNYRDTISRKVESFRGVKDTELGRATATVKELGKELSSTIDTSSADGNEEQGLQGKHSLLRGSGALRPVPVQVIPRNDPVTSVQTFLGPFVRPIGTIAIVIVFTAFILLRQEDLHDRLFTLAGLSRFHVTSQAFDEATHRVSRYLLLQSLTNLGYGLLFGTALHFVGLPNAMLWGVLAGVLRFIPYVGTIVGAAMPILLSLAVFDGWTKPLIVLGAFLVIEIVIAYVVEPLLYASHTGVSSLAILVAAIFWAALWGPTGLLLSTPLTVCIVVVGRYIPHLEFLSVLLGDERVLATEVQLYQHLLRMDLNGANRVVEGFLKEKSAVELYDSVFIPVLIFVEKDQHEGTMADDRARYILRGLREIIESLAQQNSGVAGSPEPQVERPTITKTSQRTKFDEPAAVISCLPARDEGDEIVGMMLTHLLTEAGFKAEWVSPDTPDNMLDEILERDVNFVFISALPPFAVSRIKKLIMKVHSRIPKSKIGAGLWGFGENSEAMKTHLKMGDADSIITTLAGAISQMALIAEAASNEVTAVPAGQSD
jgi:predicted PurR-regulated permease PerM